jgi:chromosome segregation ATPase
MTNVKINAIMIAAAISLTACATTAESNDPAMGGFGNAINGVWGGQYEERLATRRAEQDAARRRQMEINSVLAPLLAQRDQLSLSIRQSESRIQAQGVRIARLNEEISRGRNATTSQRSRLGELETQLTSLQRRASAFDAYSTQISHASLSADIESIERELDGLGAEFDLLAAGLR